MFQDITGKVTASEIAELSEISLNQSEAPQLSVGGYEGWTYLVLSGPCFLVWH